MSSRSNSKSRIFFSSVIGGESLEDDFPDPFGENEHWLIFRGKFAVSFREGINNIYYTYIILLYTLYYIILYYIILYYIILYYIILYYIIHIYNVYIYRYINHIYIANYIILYYTYIVPTQTAVIVWNSFFGGYVPNLPPKKPEKTRSPKS